MKKKLFLLILLFIGIQLTAQKIQWQKTLGGVHADYLYDAMPTLDYGFIMVGGSLSNDTGDVGKSEGDFDYFITKLSEYGDLEWTTTLGGTKIDILKSITNSHDGGYLIAGISNSGQKEDKKTTKNIGQQDIWLIKVNITGGIEWQKTLGGLSNENVSEVIKTKDGGYLIAGTSASSDYIENEELYEETNLIIKADKNRGNLDYWLIKIDAQGEEQWQKTFGGKYKDVLHNVIELPNRDIVIGGTSNSPQGFDKKTTNKGLNDWWVLKLTNEGEIIWQKAFGNNGSDELYELLLTEDNHLLLGGNFRNKGDGDRNANSDFVILKLDLDGEQVWQNTYSEGTNDILTDIVQNEDGTFLLSGYSASEKTQTNQRKSAKSAGKHKPQQGTEDFIVLKIDAKGEELWRKNLGTDKKEVLRKSIKTRDGGYVLMGSSMPFKATKSNDANFYIVKLLDKDKPKHIKMPLEAIPNPTYTYTSVVVGADYKEGTVTLVDFAGRVLQHFKITGKRIIPVRLTNYPDGVYIVNVKTDIETNSVKVIKISN